MPQDQEVVIDNMQFNPQAISITAGEMVKWTNKMDKKHTVTADDGSFNSGPLSKDATFSQAFKDPGTITYHCEIHPFMTGEVDVAAAAAGGAGKSTGGGAGKKG
jgi:plastocyanin